MKCSPDAVHPVSGNAWMDLLRDKYFEEVTLKK